MPNRILVKNTANEWQQLVRKTYARKNFVNYDLAVRAITSRGYDKYYNNNNVTILDAYPGLGVWSAALHNTIRPKNHIFMEPHMNYRKFLTSLCSPENTVKVIPDDPFRWSTFQTLVDEGYYRPQKQPRTHIHNEILFTANLSTAQGEQLCTQYLNCITNQSWLQRFGRVRMLLWVRETTAEKLLAQPGQKARHRVSVQCESVATGTVILGDKVQGETSPNGKATRRPRKAKKQTKKILSPSEKKSRKAARQAQEEEADEEVAEAEETLDESAEEDIGEEPEVPGHYALLKALKEDFFPQASSLESPVLLELDPLEQAVDYIDSFEYVTKMIFILRTRPLSEALTTLGPGAVEDLSPKLVDLLHVKPQFMTMDQLLRVVEAFEFWPFKPTMLHDFYDESRIE